MSRKCEAGDQLSCALLATAYEKGQAPMTAGGEIVVRNKGKAAYYDGKACALGKIWNCFYLAERYRKGEGVHQNSATAAHLYSTTCNSGETLEFGTGESCAQLGVMSIKGDGVPSNFRNGLTILKRACGMGNEYGCKMRDIYGGTGLKTSVPPPAGALGFSFGWSKAQAKSGCTDQSGQWSEQPQPGKPSVYMCDLKITALDRDGTIELSFIDGRLDSIFAAFELPTRDAGKEFARVEGLLFGLYAAPGERVVEVLDGCGSQKLGTCIKQKQATLFASWQFSDQHVITLTINGEPDGEVSLSVMYLTPESMRSAGHPGL